MRDINVTINRSEAVHFIGHSDQGHSVHIDGPSDKGGQNQGVRPMELMLMGLGGCTAFDVMTILKKSRQKVEQCTASVRAQRAQSLPNVFTHIHIHFTITGQQLSEPIIKRAISLSADKYCSASIMLGRAGVDIQHSYDIIIPKPIAD